MKDASDNLTAELNVTATPEVSKQEGLTLVQIKDVVADPQVRTETGWSDTSLNDLAESIKAHGLLQLPLLRNRMKPDGLYTVVAGHRRIEAMRRAGFESFYAIVGTATQAQADTMQLIENIQREQLSTKEIAHALRKMSDTGQTLAQIANVAKKSKPWVCKHLALTHPEFGQYAKQLFLNGRVEDVEILNMVNQIEKLKGAEWITMNHQNAWTRKATKELLELAKRDANDPTTDEDGNEQEDQTANDATQESKPLHPAVHYSFWAIEALQAVQDDIDLGEVSTAEEALTQFVNRLWGDQQDVLLELAELLQKLK